MLGRIGLVLWVLFVCLLLMSILRHGVVFCVVVLLVCVWPVLFLFCFFGFVLVLYCEFWDCVEW